jgi:hypothetical protein
MEQYEYGYLYEVNGSLRGPAGVTDKSEQVRVYVVAFQGLRRRIDTNSRLEALNSLGLEGWLVGAGQPVSISADSSLLKLADEAYPKELFEPTRSPGFVPARLIWSGAVFEFFMRRIKPEAAPGR